MHKREPKDSVIIQEINLLTDVGKNSNVRDRYLSNLNDLFL